MTGSTMCRTIASALLASGLCGQATAAEAKLEFEVASIKPAVPPTRGVIRLGRQGGPGSSDPGRVTYAGSTIRDLIVDAYNVKPSQVSGGPKWLDTERFDIVAKVPAGTTKEQLRIMLQNLLAERFKLVLHRETKESPIYALVVATRGPRLKDAAVMDAQPPSDVQPRGSGMSGMKLERDGCPGTPPMAAARAGNFIVMTPNGECMLSRSQTMEDLAKELSNRFDRPVVDQTDLKGKYDWRLRYDPASLPGRRGGPAGKDRRDDLGTAGEPTEHTGAEPPSIFSALQEQLGLRLDSRKGPVDLVVVDHLEKAPAGN